MKKIILSLILSLPAIACSQTHLVNWTNNVNVKVVNQWSKSLNKVSDVSSTTYIRKKEGGRDSLHVRKHRDVIVWVPSTTDLSRQFTMLIWFHGHHGYVPKRTFENRTLKQIVPYTKDKNFILVLPEMPWSVHTPTPTKRNSLLWMKPGSFLKFVSQVENLLLKHIERGDSNDARAKRRLGKIDYRIVGHSAGGSTIKRLGITGDLCKLNPSMIVWSDSSYGKWLDNAWEGCLKDRPNILVKVFVQKWLSPWKNATRFLGQFQGPRKNLELHVKNKGWSHKLIGDNIVKLSGVLE